MSMYNNRHLSPLRLQTTNHASVDKVHIWTDKFTVSPYSDLDIQPHIQNLSEPSGKQKTEPLFTLTDSTDIMAHKAYKNTDSYNLSIQRQSGNRPYLTISFNPNKLHHYYEPLTDKALREAQILAVRDSIYSLGIDFDYEGSKLTRVDLMKQKQFPDELSNYHQVLQSISAKRQSARAFNDTYIIGNQSHQTVIYDKSIEAKIPNKPNLIRCEIKALKGRSVQNLFKLHSVSDLIKSDEDYLTDIYNYHLRDKVFVTYSPSTHQISTELKTLEYFIEKDSRNGVNSYLKHKSILEVVSIFGSIDSFVKHIHEMGLSRQVAYRWKSKLIVCLQESIAIKDRAESRMAELYDNIYSFAV
jgi:hypothetical protein